LNVFIAFELSSSPHCRGGYFFVLATKKQKAKSSQSPAATQANARPDALTGPAASFNSTFAKLRESLVYLHLQAM
jgi:hypothetical protein